MLPHMRQIQRFEVDGESEGQSTQWDWELEENGIGTVEREVLADVGWDDMRVCEYRHTGHLRTDSVSVK